MIEKYLKLIFIFSLIVLFQGISIPVNAGKLAKINLSFLYSGNGFTNPDWIAYHITDEQTRIFGNIHLEDFTYRYAWNNDGTSKARFRIEYELLDSYESKEILDSSTVVFTDSLYFGREMNMIIHFDVGAYFPGNYILKIWLTDLNAPENHITNFVPVYKENHLTAQNFLVRDEQGFPVFDTYINESENFKLQYNDTSLHLLNIRYYDREFPLAKLPFAIDRRETYTFKPDSIYEISLTEGLTPLLSFPYKGIYFVQPELNEPYGLALFFFGDDFPEVNTADMALEPLRYLTTEFEFAELEAYKDHKYAIDSFWLDRASYNPERAKKMIKRFYSRVQDCNHMFTSYQEGWKTDRGLIYIVYGPPSEVYRKIDEEEWIYGERGNPLSIRFFFDKVENPFTENDFSLQRSPVYKTSWYIAIENWRR